jgi:hypothetical protein
MTKALKWGEAIMKVDGTFKPAINEEWLPKFPNCRDVTDSEPPKCQRYVSLQIQRSESG